MLIGNCAASALCEDHSTSSDCDRTQLVEGYQRSVSPTPAVPPQPQRYVPSYDAATAYPPVPQPFAPAPAYQPQGSVNNK